MLNKIIESLEKAVVTDIRVYDMKERTPTIYIEKVTI